MFPFEKSYESDADDKISAFGEDCVIVPVAQVTQTRIVVVETFFVVLLARRAVDSVQSTIIVELKFEASFVRATAHASSESDDLNGLSNDNRWLDNSQKFVALAEEFNDSRGQGALGFKILGLADVGLRVLRLIQDECKVCEH